MNNETRKKALELCNAMTEKINDNLARDRDLICALEVANFTEELQSLLQNEKEEVANAPTASPQIKLEDFHIGFEYEELIPDHERYLPSGIIWRKRVYCLESPKLHKIKKYIEEGKVRKIWPDNEKRTK